MRQLIDACVAKWSLSLEGEYHRRVVRVRLGDGTPAVLKISASDADAASEAAALRAFGGRGAVELLAYEPSVAALLLKRAQPGHTLARLADTDDDRAMEIAAGVIATLARSVPDSAGFPSMESWCSDLERARGTPLAADAAAVAAELRASPSTQFLLHGDLHQFNILADGESWLAIDPKGVIGERECELAPLILNPLPLARFDLSRRMRRLCELLSLDPPRAHAWTFVRAVLSIVGSIEDDGAAPEEWLACAELLRKMI